MKISETKIKFDQKKVESSYITSCSYDVQCIKPGNVNYFSGHPDTAIDDFVKSYEATSKMITSPNLSCFIISTSLKFSSLKRSFKITHVL